MKYAKIVRPCKSKSRFLRANVELQLFDFDRVARWLYIFQTKIKIWVNFGGYCDGRCWCILHMSIWYILRPFGIPTLWLFGMLSSYLVYWFPFWYVVARKIWQPCVFDWDPTVWPISKTAPRWIFGNPFNHTFAARHDRKWGPILQKYFVCPILQKYFICKMCPL
jgi:hypothetical protein